VSLCIILRGFAASALLLGACAAEEESGPADARPGYIRPGVFEKPPAQYRVSGVVATSDGKSVSGSLFSTLGKPLTLYDREAKKYITFTLSDITRIDVAIEEQQEEPYWYWKQSGSDEKVFTGGTYVWQKYATAVTFADGRKVTGDINGIVFCDSGGKLPQRFILHKRQNGAEGQKAEDIVYVKSVEVKGPAPEETTPESTSERLLSTDNIRY